MIQNCRRGGLRHSCLPAEIDMSLVPKYQIGAEAEPCFGQEKLFLETGLETQWHFGIWRACPAGAYSTLKLQSPSLKIHKISALFHGGRDDLKEQQKHCTKTTTAPLWTWSDSQQRNNKSPALPPALNMTKIPYAWPVFSACLTVYRLQKARC